MQHDEIVGNAIYEYESNFIQATAPAPLNLLSMGNGIDMGLS